MILDIYYLVQKDLAQENSTVRRNLRLTIGNKIKIQAQEGTKNQVTLVNTETIIITKLSVSIPKTEFDV